MAKIHIVVEEVTHFDWERTRIIGASYDMAVCEAMITKAENEFHSFNGEHASYYVDSVEVSE